MKSFYPYKNKTWFLLEFYDDGAVWSATKTYENEPKAKKHKWDSRHVHQSINHMHAQLYNY